MEGLERHEGHLLNWYDTESLAPLPPRYVSTVDSGNLAGALMALAEGLRQAGLPDLAGRAAAFADGMRFRFLFDPQRRILSIGYRLADVEGPGRLDPSYYDLLASEARLASFLAIARGELPQTHWFHLGRLVTSVGGTPALLSWSGTVFEYLMPLLLMKSFPGTLLERTCRMVVRRQEEYGEERGVPWGISESAYNLGDRYGNYQYKAFGVPGLGLKRGLADELVVAPYATALAAIVEPRAALRNLRRLADEGRSGTFGYYEAIDYTNASPGDPDPPASDGPASGTLVRAFMAHHQGMTLVSLANVLLDDVMVRRFHADPRVQATELLLQERVPRAAPIAQPRPVEETRVAGPAAPQAARRFRSPHTLWPHAQFLSNGSYTTVVTNAGGGASFCRGRVVTRHREDATRDPGSQFVYLRDVRSGAVWSATHHPVGVEAEDYAATFLAEKAAFSRRDDGIASLLEIAVSTEDDVEVRRLAVTNHSDRSREIEVTSYAEIVLGKAADDLAHPAFGKLFVETEYLHGQTALLCRRRPRSPEDPEVFGVHVLSLEGRSQSPLEWETDRARFLGRGRSVEDPLALDGRSLSGTVGVVLDPIVSLRQRIRLAPGGFARLSFATGMALSRETALALAQKYHEPSSAARTFALALAHVQSARRHLGVTGEEALLYERLASRVLYADRSLRAAPDVLARTTLGQEGLWAHGISGDLPVLLVRVVEEDDLPLVREVLQAQEYWRLKGLHADVVILNEHPVSYLDEMHGQLAALLDNGPWRSWNHQPGGAFLLRADRMGEAERLLLAAVARTVLSGDRGDLSAQLEHAYAHWPEPEPADLVPSRAAEADAAPAEIETETLALAERPRRLRRRRPRLRARPRRRRPDAAPLGERDRQPRVRHHRHCPRLRSHVGREQPREPPHAVRERPRRRPDRRGPLPARRGDGRGVVPDAGADAADDDQPLPRPALGRADELLSREPRPAPRARRVRGPERSGEALPAHPREHERAPATAERLRLQRVDPRAAPRGPGDPRGDGARRGERRDPRPQPLQHRVPGARGLRARERELPLGHGRPRVVPGPQRIAGEARRPAPRGSVRAVRRRARSLRRPARARRPRARRDANARLPARPGGQRRGRASDPVPSLLARGGRGRAPREPPVVGPHARRRAGEHTGRLLRPADEPVAPLPGAQLPHVGAVGLLPAGRRVRVPRPAPGRDGARPRPPGPHPRAAAARRARTSSRRATSSTGGTSRAAGARAPAARTTCSGCRTPPRTTSRTTGDTGVLDEVVPFLEAPPLAPEAAEAYIQPRVGAQAGSLFEHCTRAIERGITAGAHGLPLFGSGDWNDGMNRVGIGGRGESAWLGFFLHAVLAEFAPLCAARGDTERVERYRREGERLAGVLERTWDGEWYRRGYYDDGSPLGSAQSEECRIDSVAQSWAVLSAAVPQRFADRAMDAVRAHLVRRGHGLVALLTPPFDRSAEEPGYIKGYPPGVRENGGQYTHAAVWAVMAMARLGYGDDAVELFHMLNPANHTRTAADVERYRGEPYVLAGDVLAHAAHAGRAGWTWYTGSAGWMYRAGLETILGLRRCAATFAIDPCIPAAWPGYSLTWRLGATRYEVEVENPGHRSRGVAEAWLDDRPVDPRAVPLADDGRQHRVRVVMGEPAATAR